MSTERKSKRRRKRCEFCRQLFQPDPRVGARQIACSDPGCQKARKRRNQAEWLERHPGYFRGRYGNTRLWLDAHPGYLSDYRREHPEQVARDNDRRKVQRVATSRGRETGPRPASEEAADIQDSISLEGLLQKALTPSLVETDGADIQDSIWPQVVLLSAVTADYVARRYTRLDRPAPAPPVPSLSVAVEEQA